MKLDYNRLIELLNSFGLSLKIENGSVIFVDIETNLPMKSYVVYKEGFADQKVEYIADANILLDGWPFYLKTENKHFRLSVLVKDGNIRVSEITKTERKEPHLYESSELQCTSRTYTIEETTYRRHTREDGTECLSRDVISNVTFGAIYGSIVIHTNNKCANICFKKNSTTGEIVPDFREEHFEEISQQEATELVEQSRVFKDTMKTLCPTLAESYLNAKISGVKPIR